MIASFVIYKLIGFFHNINKRSHLDKAITKWGKPLKNTDAQDDWKNKTDEDKIEEFYEVVISIISTKAGKDN